jgi:hypothetical protein
LTILQDFDELREGCAHPRSSETRRAPRRFDSVQSDAGHLLWPRWATWALIAVILTSIVTIVATIEDIW